MWLEMAKSAHSAKNTLNELVDLSHLYQEPLEEKSSKLGGNVLLKTVGALYFSGFPWSGPCIFKQRSHSERSACVFVQASLKNKEKKNELSQENKGNLKKLIIKRREPFKVNFEAICQS